MERKTTIKNVSLARALSKLGFTSRSQAAQLILTGHVSVNRKTIKDPTHFCSLTSDVILIDGKPIRKKQFVYIIMNKPVDVVTTRSDEKKRKTVYDILGDVGRWVFPVGRLDKDTSGLLIMTNDNQFGERLTNPNSKVPKTYRSILDQPMTAEHAAILQSGLTIKGESYLPAIVKVLDDKEIILTIVEGKNRQIRRMCEFLGYKVEALCRSMIGNLSLKNLQPGEWRNLTEQEIKSLDGGWK
jgi:23S rRNA pseudouridine2605 synthase